MLDNKLIENALALTGKTMSHVEIDDTHYWPSYYDELFCYYLLSEDFLKQYYLKIYPNEPIQYYEKEMLWNRSEIFWRAIYEYQSGNEEPLITLLQKIN